MSPLRVTALVPGQIALPNGPLALDSLLACQVALRDGLPPPSSAADCVPIQIPVQLEPGGRFHLCSFSEGGLTEFDIRYVNRRAPTEAYVEFGVPGRVQINGGPDKSYRIPLEVGHVAGGELVWWCVGDAEQIRQLLATVGYLGKKRNVGLGRVAGWTVEPCETWPGFPVVRDGRPLRPLPQDWPGLEDPPLAYRVLSYPYFDHTREELLACPS